MTDFNPQSVPISKAAQKVVSNIDATLTVFRDRRKSPSELHLYAKHWDTLNQSLLDASNKGISLNTHRYRGVQLLRDRKK